MRMTVVRVVKQRKTMNKVGRCVCLGVFHTYVHTSVHVEQLGLCCHTSVHVEQLGLCCHTSVHVEQLGLCCHTSVHVE